MLQRLARDESGVALGLAIIMIVLVGVMGAGLLVFVRNDLQAVVKVNQGHKALAAADAGVQAARRQILSDATEATYNKTNGTSPWSPNNGGKSLTFDGNTVNVKIQYLRPSTASTRLTNPDYAPELVPAGKTDYPEPKDYFKVTSDATIGETRRKIEAIYSTVDLNVPKGYYTPESITLEGPSACIDSVSLFALRDITFDGSGGCTDAAGNKIGAIKGMDRAYGYWSNPPFNTTARPTEDAGAGAAGRITYSGGAAAPEPGKRDFDGPDPDSDGPEFIRKDPPGGSQSPTEISFPFDRTLPDIDFLRDEARLQGNYHEVSGGTVSLSTLPGAPAGRDPSRTMVFYRFTGAGTNNLKWDVPGTCTDNPPVQGTLVVENGNFTAQPSRALFRGAVIVRGGEAADGRFEDTGSTCLEGFVNAQGSIKVAGKVSPMSSPETARRPGFYDAKLWSWRELYQ